MPSALVSSLDTRCRSIFRSLFGLLGWLCLTGSLGAIDFTWTGGTSSDFTVGSNWGGTAPSPTGLGTGSPQAWRFSVQGGNTLIYSGTQGHTVLSGGGSNRSLFIANGLNVNASMSITGGIFESTSSAPDGMVNGDNAVALLSIDGGTYRKTTGTGAQSTFAVRYAGGGTSQATLDINSGSFEVTTLDLQNAGATSTLAVGTPETIVNLDGGTLSVGTIVRNNNSPGIDAVLNFNGGTLQARQDSTTFIAALGQFTANVQAGGALVDTQGFNVTISAPLVHDAALGATLDGGLTKIGTGALTLSGVNTYSGGTFIKNGTLVMGGNNRLPTNSIVTLGDSVTNDSGVLKLDSRSQTLAVLLTVGAGTGNRVINGNATAGTLIMDVATANAFSGILGGATADDNNFTLTKQGAGTLTLSGANTYTGVTTVSVGILQFATQVSLYNNVTANWTATNLIVNSGATAAFNVGGAGEFTSSDIAILAALGTGSGGFKSGSAIALDTTNAGGEFTYGNGLGNPNGGSNVLGLTKLGTGILTLTQANTYTGKTTVSAGVLKAGAAGGGTVFGANSSIILADVAGVTLDLNSFDQTIGSLGGGGSTGGTVSLGSATLSVGGINSSGSFAGVIDGAGAVTKIGTGNQTLTGANTYSGLTTVSAGILTVANNAALGTTAGGTSVLSGATLALADGITVTGETIGIAGSGGDSMGALQAIGSAEWSGAVTIESSGARLGAQVGGVLTVSGQIQNGASNTLAISAGIGGTGTVIISGTGNTYTGTTQIIRGVLKLGATNALPTGTILDVDSAVVSVSEDSVFDLNGFNQSVIGLQSSGAGTGTGGSFITNTSALTSTLTVVQSGTTNYKGIIMDGTGVVNLTKSGGGSLTLSGANTFTGTITLSAVTNNEIVVAHNNALGGTLGGTTVGNGARVTLANGMTVAGETITITGNGGNNFGALQSATNATAEWAGNVIVTGADSRIGGGVGGTLIVSGVISGSYAVLFSRADNSTTILNAVNTYTGDTQLFSNGSATGSKLIIGVDNAINAASRLSVISTAATKPIQLDLNGHVLTLRSLDTSGTANHATGAVLSIANNAASTASILTLSDPAANTTIYAGTLIDGTSGTGGLSLVKSGANTQILIGNNTYTGSTTVNSGTLQIGASVSTLGVNGALASTSFKLKGGVLVIDNTGASNNNSNRLSDSADIVFNGGSFTYKGSDQAATNSSETVHDLTVVSGLKTLSVIFGGSNTATLTANQITRAAQGGVLLVNGANLGMDSSSTASVARVFFTNVPTLIGTTDALSTGINAAAKDTKIVPFLLGEATSTTGGFGTATGTPNTFLTYDPTTGLRPLNPTDEFTQNSFVTGNNTRLTTTTNVAASISINSLVLDGGSATIAGGQTLTVDSGAILFVSGSGVGITGGTLNFGAQEGIVTINSAGNTFISSIITGTGGVTYSGSGQLVLQTQQNTYSGDTLLQVASVIPQANSIGPDGAPVSGSFGTGTLIFAGSAIRATTSNDITIGNNVSLAADTTVISSGIPSSDRVLTLTGEVTLTGGDRILTQNSGANTVLSGAIGDGGNNFGLTIAGSGAGAVVLSGTSTYTGATNVTSGRTLQVGDGTSGSLTGAGAVTVSGAGSTLSGSGSIAGSTTIGAGAVLAPGVGDTAASNMTMTFDALASTLTVQDGGSIELSITAPTFQATGVFDQGVFGGAESTALAYLQGSGSGSLAAWNSSTPGDHDFIDLGSGTLSLGTGAGTITLLSNGYGAAQAQLGDVFNLMDWAGIATGAFNASTDFTLPDLSSAGLGWDTSAFTNYGIVVVVPEPSRVILLLAGLGGLLMRRRRAVP